MSYKLITVATFNTPAEAHIAKNRLEAERILAFLANEAIVGMEWDLGTAVGGIKLQVREEDAERAVSVLEEDGASPKSDSGKQRKEKKNELDFAFENADEDESVSPVDETMARAFKAAILGILFLPLQLYSLWLLLSIARARDPLSPANRRKFAATLVLNAPIYFVTGFLLWSMFFE